MAEEATKPESTEEEPKKKSLVGKLIKIFVVLVLLLIIVIGGLVVLGPTIVLSGAGQNILKEQVNARAPGTVDWKTINAGWTSPISAEGLKYEDNERPLVVEIESFNTPSTILDFLQNNGSIQTAEANNITVTFTVPKDLPESETPKPEELKEQAENAIGDLLKTVHGFWDSGVPLSESISVNIIVIQVLREGETTPESSTTEENITMTPS